MKNYRLLIDENFLEMVKGIAQEEDKSVHDYIVEAKREMCANERRTKTRKL